jgi:hypothetical protein
MVIVAAIILYFFTGLFVKYPWSKTEGDLVDEYKRQQKHRWE